MRSTHLFATAFACVLVSGCTTHLQSQKHAGSGIIHGLTYHLPEMHYDVEVRRVLTRCPEVPDRTHAAPTGQIEFDISATATPRTVAGPALAIDYQSLATWTKTTDFLVERYPSGILKSVNAKVDDRTSEVMTQAFKALVSVGKIAIGLPSGGATSTDGELNYFLACSSEVKQVLSALPGLKKSAKEKELALKKAAKALDDFEAAHKEVPRPNDVAAQATELVRAKLAAQQAFDDANGNLADAMKSITVVSRFTYVPGEMSPSRNRLNHDRHQRFIACIPDKEKQIEEAQSIPNDNEWVAGVYQSIADEAVDTPGAESIVQLRTRELFEDGSHKWLIHTLGPEMTPDCSASSHARWADADGRPSSDDTGAQARAAAHWDPSQFERLKDLRKVINELSTTDVLVTASALATSNVPDVLPDATQCSQKEEPHCGILYRTKVPSRLRICRSTESDGLSSPAGCLSKGLKDPAVLVTDDRPIPQLGRLASLALRNGPFANNELLAEFSEDGSLIKFGYKKPQAEAVAVGGTVNSGLDAVTSLITYANGAELRDLEDQKKLNDARVALLNSQKAMQQPSETTKLENEAGLLKARRELIEAEIALRKKQAELDAMNASGEAGTSE